MKHDATEAWVTGQLAVHLLAVDPGGLGGLHLRARAGPVRTAFLDALPVGLKTARKIGANVQDTQLFGGIDISATLAAGQVVRSHGLLSEPVPLMLTMAERCPPGLAARLAQAMDAGRQQALILMDEGCDEDETAPATLTERLAFHVNLDGLRPVDLAEMALAPDEISAAQACLPGVTVSDDMLALMVVTAARFGIDSLRAPLLALAAARAHAALSGRPEVEEDDAQIAAQLVFAHRATLLPQEEEDAAQEPDEDTSADPEDSSKDQQTEEPDVESEEGGQNIPQDMLIEAVKAFLPPEILSALSQKSKGGGKGSGGAGQRRKGNRRGRPLPSRPGKLDGSSRIDIVATLRAAAPWQMLRRAQTPDRAGLLIRPSDIHVRRYQEMSDRLIIFAVDASGSSAMARLSEAKGAIELMLAEAYARRDHVALIAFRGEQADLILPPTRSLVQTKRRLSGLPGGGGTPLAAGLQASAELARRVMGQGLSPALALLTDGRANVPLPGRTGRAAATEDAEIMAGLVRRLNIPAAVVDTSVRPRPELSKLAGLMGARYVPLPRADAQGLSRAIGAAIAD
ncbi:hypothetical protein P775_06235 [Puniceibacterium antarcticum]|uniref:Mg-protoporphyrin IX chelatase n=1 Tax=Puniceibacterium antarcticum TaxID=1206336 RepID=A0A2G8RI26_9RHOB|nr:magnesium chelatase subunit D [Puniceibacterium antarcticum]PIL21143.1 hypothetical protein P775_06235 [Puniceibacterium antarcticum]